MKIKCDSPLYKKGIPKNYMFARHNFLHKDLPGFITKKWVEIQYQSEKNYSVNKEIRIKHQC